MHYTNISQKPQHHHSTVCRLMPTAMKVRLCSCMVTLLLSVVPYAVTAQQTDCFVKSTNGLQLSGNIDFTQYSGFYVGEFHDDPNVPEIKLALIRHLNESNGVNAVFMEIGRSAADLYNRYLQTGDTSYITNPGLVYNNTAEGKLFWKALYEFNNTLQLHNKITIYGIDFERMEFLKALKMLAPGNRGKPNAIKQMLDYADTVQLQKVNSDTLTSIYFRYRNDLKKHKKQYRDYFGNNIEMVRSILNNEATYLNYDNRNTKMYHNIATQLREHKINQFVVFTGLKHGGTTNINKFGNYMKGKTAGIAMVCNNCGNSTQNPGGFKGPAAYSNDTVLMKKIFEQANTQCDFVLMRSADIYDERVSSHSEFILLLKHKRLAPGNEE